MLAVNEQDVKVADYLKEIGVSYQVSHTAEILHEDWQHDLFYVVFSRARKITGGGKVDVKPSTQGFEYKTGIGHRVNPNQPKHGFNSRYLSPGQLREKKKLDEVIGCNSIHEAKHATKRYVSNEFIVKPTQASVLYSLILDSSAQYENFDDWAENYGYSSDSIEALNTYKACLENAKKLHSVFTTQQIEKLQELLEDY